MPACQVPSLGERVEMHKDDLWWEADVVVPRKPSHRREGGCVIRTLVLWEEEWIVRREGLEPPAFRSGVRIQPQHHFTT